MSGFDFGADPITGGGNLKQASPGPHEARIKGILHLGIFEDEHKGQKKPAAPYVYVLCEIKDDEDNPQRNEDDSPICVGRSFPLKKGDRASLTGFMKAVLTPEELAQFMAGTLSGGFGDLIGRAVQIEMVAGKTADDGTQYTNLKTFTAMTSKAKKLVEELETPAVGHITMDQHTEETLRHLPAFEIYTRMENSHNFPGSAAEAALLSIRKDDPEFGTKRAPNGNDKAEAVAGAASKPVAPPAGMDEETEFE